MLPPIKGPPFSLRGAINGDEKDLFRLKLKAERKAAARAREGYADFAARHAARLFIDRLSPAPDAVVALYHPLDDELDTEPLFDALVEREASIVLPRTPQRAGALDFKRFAPGDALTRGKFGVREPAEGAPAATPSIVVCPLLGFTRAGARLGYGGGYYDRTLAALRQNGAVIAVGYAYAAQEVDALPAGPLDEPLDWVVTERDAFQVGGG